MKLNMLFLSIAMLVLKAKAEMVKDSVLLGAGYTDQSYYSLNNGEISNTDNTNWDIAFDASDRGYTIRTNGSIGTGLYLYPNGDSSGWATLDTTGLSAWTVLYNSDTSWGTGAFNRYENGNDLGWGNYNTVTHNVDGDSLYVIKLSSGEWKKIWIKKLAGGVYTFRYSNLDGSDEVNASLDKSGYSGRNFAYYSLQADSEIDREPANTDWDIMFTKYVTALAPGMYYGVTGTLTNSNVTVSEARGIDVNSVSYNAFPYETAANIIGYDWKAFNNQTFQYTIDDSLCYFVNDLSGKIWRLVFTGFEGSSTGKIVFNKEGMVTTRIENSGSPVKNFSIYPNPTSGTFSVLFMAETSTSVGLSVHDLTGKQVYSQHIANRRSGLNQEQISLSSLLPGIYFVSLVTGNYTIQQKLIINK